MTKNFLRSTQYLICLNLLCQLFWLAHLNWPDFFHLYLEQLIYLVTSVGIIHTVSGIFIGIYLFKKQFRISFYLLVLYGIYYMFILYYWYQLVIGNVNLDGYMLAYYGLTAISVILGLSLVLSAVRRKIWIKRAGIVIIVFSIMHISAELFPQMMQNPALQMVRTLGSFLASFGSILWILNFQDEIKSLPRESNFLVDGP